MLPRRPILTRGYSMRQCAPTKLALVQHLGNQLAILSEDGDARFPMTKHRMTRHQLKTF